MRRDEDITSISTTSPIEDVAEIRLGPMTRSRSKLIEQDVNSLLVDYDNFIDENFKLHKCYGGKISRQGGM